MPDGFYLLYDPNRYGWEPVWVSCGSFTRCGIKGDYRCTDFLAKHFTWQRVYPQTLNQI